jgi:hypothetical protein
MNFNLNFFKKNYKYISESESSENLLSCVQNNQIIEVSPNNKNQLVKKDSIEFSDFEQAVILDNNTNEFANFDEHLFINDSDRENDIENEVNNIVNDLINDLINDVINDVIINDEVKNTLDYLINYCEDFCIEYKYELVGYITNLFYKENNIAYVVRVNDPEQFKQYKINTYNIIGMEGIFYWNEKSILKVNDNVLVQCTYIGNSCKYKLNKIIKKL